MSMCNNPNCCVSNKTVSGYIIFDCNKNEGEIYTAETYFIIVKSPLLTLKINTYAKNKIFAYVEGDNCYHYLNPENNYKIFTKKLRIIKIYSYEEFGKMLNGTISTSIQQIQIVNGIRNGPYKDFYETGELRTEGEFKNDVLTGKLIAYRKDGSIISHTYYNDNIYKIIYNTDGLLTATTLTKDNLTYCTKYYLTGAIESVYTYINGNLNGKSTKYHPNGKIWFTLNYIDNLIEGEFFEYDTNGKLIEKKIYEKNIIVYSSLYFFKITHQ